MSKSAISSTLDMLSKVERSAPLQVSSPSIHGGNKGRPKIDEAKKAKNKISILLNDEDYEKFKAICEQMKLPHATAIKIALRDKGWL